MTLPYALILFACSTAFGSIMGAYFGTVDYRMRCDEPLVTSQCYCPVCRHQLAFIHQIPVVSWFLLKGKCRYCHSPIPIRYLLIESSFFLYYGTSFLILLEHPFLTLGSWSGFVLLLLFFRCDGHFASMAKGAAIFAGYHLIYGAVFLAVHAALEII